MVKMISLNLKLTCVNRHLSYLTKIRESEWVAQWQTILYTNVLFYNRKMINSISTMTKKWARNMHTCSLTKCLCEKARVCWVLFSSWYRVARVTILVSRYRPWPKRTSIPISYTLQSKTQQEHWWRRVITRSVNGRFQLYQNVQMDRKTIRSLLLTIEPTNRQRVKSKYNGLKRSCHYQRYPYMRCHYSMYSIEC